MTNVMADASTDSGFEFVKLMDKRTRKLGLRKVDFTALDNTTEKVFGGNEFHDHSHEIIRVGNIMTVKMIRGMYAIHDDIDFVGVERTIAMPEIEQNASCLLLILVSA